MTFKKSTFIGIIAATISYPFLLPSVILSPWFNVFDNALSDLGNLNLNAPTAYIFNAGIMLSGLFVAAFAILVSSGHHDWKYLIWTVPLSFAGLSLIMVGIFPINSGIIHGLVSVGFFVTMIITMLVYSFSSWLLGSPRIGVIALTFGIASVLIWSSPWPWDGVAVQETLTTAMASSWLIMVSRH